MPWSPGIISVAPVVSAMKIDPELPGIHALNFERWAAQL
jgi:hypothetical protein